MQKPDGLCFLAQNTPENPRQLYGSFVILWRKKSSTYHNIGGIYINVSNKSKLCEYICYNRPNRKYSILWMDCISSNRTSSCCCWMVHQSKFAVMWNALQATLKTAEAATKTIAFASSKRLRSIKTPSLVTQASMEWLNSCGKIEAAKTVPTEGESFDSPGTTSKYGIL